MTETENPASEVILPGPVKAAVLMLYLGEEVCSEIFTRLSEDEVMQVSQGISRLGSASQRTTEEVTNELRQELTGRSDLQGSISQAIRFLESAFTPDVARRYIREIGKRSRLNVKALALLKKSDPMQLSKLLQSEHPQTVALVVSHLHPDRAAKTVGLLEDDLRADVCLRLVRLNQISKPVRDQVIGIMAQKLGTGSDSLDSDSIGGVRRVAEILNQMDSTVSRTCLENIENENPNMALAIRNEMFVFEDLLVMNDKDMRKIIQSVDKKTMVTALKGTSEELKEHFFRNMSKRAVEMLKEDMEAQGPIKLRTAEEAQRELVNAVREMEQAGDIEIGGGGSDEYVS